MKMVPKILLSTSFAILPLMGAEQENNWGGGDTKSYTLQKSVVSASGFDQELKDAPASISVITKEQLEDKPFRDIAEAVSTIPGVSIDSSVGRTGGYVISIRGMPPNYTLILLDGKRQNITSSVFANGFGESVFSSFMPPLAAIERIEVIKGPMSTLYGSDAIGGVVNIITKKNFDRWSSSFVIQTTLEEEKLFGNLYGGSFYTSGPLDSAKKWGLSLRGSETYRAFVPLGDLKVIPDGKSLGRGNLVGLSESNMYDVGGRISYSPSEENYFYIDAQNALQWHNNTQELLATTGSGKKGGTLGDIYYIRSNFIAAHQGKYSFGKTDTSIQYISAMNKGRVVTEGMMPPDASDSIKSLIGKERGLRGDDVIVDSKLDFSFGKDWYSNHMTVGGRYWFSSMHDKGVFDSNFIYQHNGALFVEDEWSFLENLFLTLGVREDYSSGFGFNTSPRAYLVYNAFDWLTLKGGVSTGYKTPELAEFVKGVNGVSGQGKNSVYGNPDLKPERSINYEFSILSETDWTDVGVTGFFNTFEDKLLSQSVKKGEDVPVVGGGTCNGIEACRYKVNADSAITYGAEVFFGLKPIDIVYGNIGLNLNYTFTKTELTSGKDKGITFNNVPEHSLNGSLNYAIGDFGFYLRGEMRIKQSRKLDKKTLQDLQKNNPDFSPYYKNYGLLHIGGNYKINKHFTIHAGIYNLLNHNFIDYHEEKSKNKSGGIVSNYVNSYNYVREGRRYFISLNMDF